jgi:hypothetical protein
VHRKGASPVRRGAGRKGPQCTSLAAYPTVHTRRSTEAVVLAENPICSGVSSSPRLRGGFRSTLSIPGPRRHGCSSCGVPIAVAIAARLALLRRRPRRSVVDMLLPGAPRHGASCAKHLWCDRGSCPLVRSLPTFHARRSLAPRQSNALRLSPSRHRHAPRCWSACCQ